MQNHLTGIRVGRVASYSSKKGYGFLEDLDTKALVFVHHSSLVKQQPGWRDLWIGEYVNYVLLSDKDGRVGARNVTGINGGPLMCESRTREFLSPVTQRNPR